jgi:RNA polymerase sigma-70 factor (ECF subfamily)
MEAGDLYRLHARAVLGYLRGQGVRDPEDVLSEVFLQVARSLPGYRGDEADLRRWVFGIARHRLLDARRRQRARPVMAATPRAERAGPAPEEPLDEDLLMALRQLTPDQREVVVLRFVADLPLHDVAALTGRTEGAVKSMQHRALDQLARILRDPASAERGDG